MTGIMSGFAGINSIKAPVFLGRVGSLANKTAGTAGATTGVITSTSFIPTGTLLILGVSHDNAASTTTPTVTLNPTNGVSWTNLSNASSGLTTTAGSGIFGRVYYLLTTADIANSTTITYITYSTTITSHAVAIWGFTNMTTTLRSATALPWTTTQANVKTSTAGTPTATTGETLVAKDLVIGVVAGEHNVVPTADTDTLNGSWSTISGAASSGGTANTNCSIGLQYKIITATGAQTFNPTIGAAVDSTVTVWGMVPA